jgi:signal transduction histidine kinase
VVPGIWFSARQDLPLLIESLRFAHVHAPAVTWRAPEQAVPLERDDMLELLGNLLDNACKWARQRIELAIDVQTDAAGGSAFLIDLQDDGPGIDDPLRDQVLVRGSRLDERVEGHGLGLGIVNDIVTAYGGDIRLEKSALGGLQVCVRLPLNLLPAPKGAG